MGQHRHNALAGLLLAVCIGTAWARPIEDVKDLVEQGKPADAYTLGSQQPDLLGDADFDFWFGIAAIDAGHADEGVLALERYLLIFPNNPRGRLELARGYFVLGEDGRAQEEFEAVKALKPPADVATTIDRYLDVLRQRAARYETTVRGYVEAGLGTDSNINSGVGSASISLPVFGSVVVGNAGVQKGDLVQQLVAGGAVTQPVAPSVTLFGSADWEIKDYPSNGNLTQDTLTAAGGVHWFLGAHQLRALVSEMQLNLGHGPYRTTESLGGEWSYQLDELQSLQGSAQFATLNYADGNSVRDAEMTSLVAAYRRVLPMVWQPVVTAAAVYSAENNVKQRNDLSRDIYGLKLSVAVTPDAQWTLGLAYSYQQSPYRQADPLLLVRRQDSFQSVEFFASYQLDRNLSLKGELSWMDNASNVSLYNFTREAAMIKLRYEFK